MRTLRPYKLTEDDVFLLQTLRKIVHIESGKPPEERMNAFLYSYPFFTTNAIFVFPEHVAKLLNISADKILEIYNKLSRVHMEWHSYLSAEESLMANIPTKPLWRTKVFHHSVFTLGSVRTSDYYLVVSDNFPPFDDPSIKAKFYIERT